MAAVVPVLFGGRNKPRVAYDFLSGSLPSNMTFSRASNATMFDATGTMVYAPSNTIIDSYFENPTIATNWRPSVGSGGSAEISRVTTYPNDFGGGAVARFVGTKNGDSISTSVAAKPQFITPFSYTISALVRGSGKVGAQFQTDGGSTISGTETTLTDDWQLIYVTGTPSNTAKGNARVALLSDNVVECFISYIKMERTSYNSPQPYVPTTTATYYGARFDHDPVSLAPRGLLVEGQRTNLCTRSYQIASWTNSGTLSTDNNIYVSPDGTQNASRIVVDAQNKGRYIFSTVSEATFYAVSGYVKYFDGDPIWRVGTENTEDTPSQGMLIINTQTGVLVNAGTKTYSPYVVMLPSGWVYFRYYVKTGAAQTSVALVIYSQIDVAGNRTVSLWGVQLEAGITATSYIPTAGAAVTRVADQAYFASNSPWYNPTEGTLYMETMVPYTATSARAYMAAFTDGTSNTLEGGFYETNGKPTGGAVISGTAYLSGQALAGTTALAINKSVIGYKSGDNRFATNGVLDTAGDLGALSVPSGMNQLWLGNRTALDRPLNGWVRRVRYWNRRLTDSELVRLST